MPFPLRNTLPFLLAAGAFTAHAQAGAAQLAPAAADSTARPLLAPTKLAGAYPNYKTYLNTRYANDKNARAAIHMFGRKQTGGLVWLLGGGGLFGLFASQTGTTTSSSGTRTFTISPVGYVVFTGLIGGISIGKFARFNNNRLYEALKEYDQSRSFPGYVALKIKDKDYR